MWLSVCIHDGLYRVMTIGLVQCFSIVVKTIGCKPFSTPSDIENNEDDKECENEANNSA